MIAVATDHSLANGGALDLERLQVAPAAQAARRVHRHLAALVRAPRRRRRRVRDRRSTLATLGRLIDVDARDVGAASDQPFAEQKPQRQLAIGARRPHDDGKRLAVDAHLERRFDGDVIGGHARLTATDDVDGA